MKLNRKALSSWRSISQIYCLIWLEREECLALTSSRASLAAVRAEVAWILASLDAAIASSPAATAASDILTAPSMADSREDCDMVEVRCNFNSNSDLELNFYIYMNLAARE